MVPAHGVSRPAFSDPYNREDKSLQTDGSFDYWLRKKEKKKKTHMRLKDFRAAQLSNQIRVRGDVRDVSPGASVDTVEPPSLTAQPEAAQEAQRLTPNANWVSRRMQTGNKCQPKLRKL